MDNNNKPDDIPNFFENKIVFVTGVSGFLGHVLVAKLLHSCADIKKIYILLREKRNKNIKERIHDIFCNVHSRNVGADVVHLRGITFAVFDKLRKDRPNFLEKIEGVEGELLKPGLGICERTRQLLIEEVQIIFHVAATVRFEAPLKEATYINVRSTNDLLDMATKMKKLEAFVHVSTAFSHCANRKIVEEKLYESPMAPERLLRLVDEVDETFLDEVTPLLLKSYPNTYVFTKAISEGLYASEKTKNLPITIFRPAIVISTANEPIPGWINNYYGPTGVCAAAALGLLRTIHADEDRKANVVPCDYVINAMIASAWYTARQFKLRKLNDENYVTASVPVFNYTNTETSSALTWRQFMEMNESLESELPFSSAMWAYSFTMNRNKFIYQIYVFFLHLLPAFVIDTVAVVSGKKPRLTEAYRKIHKLSHVLSYFSTRDWVMPNTNVRKLWKMLADRDKQSFYFDVENINWREYFRNHMAGIRLYICNDSMDTLEEAKRKRTRLLVMHYTLLFIFTSLPFVLCCGAYYYYIHAES